MDPWKSDCPGWIPGNPVFQDGYLELIFGDGFILNKSANVKEEASAAVDVVCSTTRIIPEIIPAIFQGPIRKRLVSCNLKWCPVLLSSN
jgi:hypothetical protein